MTHDNTFLAELMQQIAGSQTQATLSNAMRAGEAALAKLYDATVNVLFAAALRVVRNHADAEDVLCEVFKQVWERPAQYQRERGPVIAWLFVIVRTRALDLIRKRRDHVDIDQHSASIVDSSADPVAQADDLLQSMQEKSSIRAALLQLSQEQRRMLDLAYFHDMSHQEIAEQTGVALGTVKSHIRRGQQALQQLLHIDGFQTR
jgi:RNA polymerase sigma-70 factor, ECF subfamily